MIKTVIFDLDGTLLNTVGDLTAAGNYVLRLHNYPEHRLEDYYLMTGNGITKLVERMILPEKRTSDYILALRKEFIKYYQLNIHVHSFAYKNIPELLNQLIKRQINICVASNKYQEGTEILMKYYFPNVRFATIVGQQDNYPTKPHPYMVEKILSDTNSKTTECFYAGDTNVDVETAHNANIREIGVTWGFRSKEELCQAGADYLIDDPLEMLDIINNNNMPIL